MFLVQCCKLCNHKYASNIKGKWSKKNCLSRLFVVDSIHACLSVTVTTVIVRKVVILLWYAIEYYTWNLLLIVCIMACQHPCCCHQCKETVKIIPLPLIDCFILTSQVISIDWSTLWWWSNYRTPAQIWVHEQLSTYERNGQLITVRGNLSTTPLRGSINLLHPSV